MVGLVVSKGGSEMGSEGGAGVGRNDDEGEAVLCSAPPIPAGIQLFQCNSAEISLEYEWNQAD